MKIKIFPIMIFGLIIALVSIGSVGMVIMGHDGFRWAAYIFIPLGSIYVLIFSIMVIAGVIEKK